MSLNRRAQTGWMPGRPVAVGGASSNNPSRAARPRRRGQAVAAPPAFPRDVFARNGGKTGVDALKGAGPEVVEAGPAVRGGRALEKPPSGGALPRAQRRGKDVGVPPLAQDTLLERD